MLRGLAICGCLFVLLGFVAKAATGTDRVGRAHRPLDLPSGGVGSDEDEEDVPESILFYGAEYEGDGFFWCLDKSCSMLGVQIETLKQEVTAAVQSLSRQSDIGIVAFSTNTVAWREHPLRADSAAKNAAIAWTQQLAAGGGTIMAPAGVKTLEISNQSRKRSKTIIVLGDGRPADESAALQDITNANYQRTRINTILIQDESGIAFMQALAAQNNGVFRFIP